MQEALNIQQRRKRANIAHRNKNKLERAREISQKKLAPESNIKKRAFALARKILRKKIAGGRGAEYQTLGPTEKEAIDKQLDKRKALIKKIAARLMPRVKQSEQHRLQSFLKGAAMKNIDEAFEKKFADKKVKKKKGETGYIKILDKFTEEAEINSKIYKSLAGKAEKYSVDLEVVAELYNSAFEDYKYTDTNLSEQQFAFARVNHKLNELSKSTLGSYIGKSMDNRDRFKKRTGNLETFAKRLKHRNAKRTAEGGRNGENYVNLKRKEDNRSIGIKRAVSKLTKEETLDELSKDSYNSYINTAYKARNKEFMGKNNMVTMDKRKKGIESASRLSNKKTNESYDLSEETLGENFKKGDYIYLKTKTHLGSPSGGKVKEVHDEHYTIDSGFKGSRGSSLYKVKKDNTVSEVEHKAKIRKDYEDTIKQNLKEGQVAEYGKLVKSYKTAQGKPFDLFQKGDIHTLVKRYDNYAMHNYTGMSTREIHRTLLKRFIPEEVDGAKEYWKDLKSKYDIARKSGNFKTAKRHGEKLSSEHGRAQLKLHGLDGLSEEILDEGNFIVSGVHQDHGNTRTKIYQANSTEHAKSQFTDDHGDNYGHFKVKNLRLPKLRGESVEHTNCGTPDCCGQCSPEPVNEFLLTAAVLALKHRKKITSGIKSTADSYKSRNITAANKIKQKQDFQQRDITAKETIANNKLSSQDYLKKREAMIKNEETLDEVLGPENQIGTKALVKKLQKLTPGQEQAQVNEELKAPLMHFGTVMIHRANKEQKVIKFSEPHPHSMYNERNGEWRMITPIAVDKYIRDHPEVKKHKAEGWSSEGGIVSHKKINVIRHLDKHLKDHAFRKYNLKEELDLGENCWKGYKQLGMKKKGKKLVPNCVKEEAPPEQHAKLAKGYYEKSDYHHTKASDATDNSKKTLHNKMKIIFRKKANDHLAKATGYNITSNNRIQPSLKEDVKSAEMKGVIVPAYIDAYGNTIPAKVIKRKVGNKILKTGDPHDGI